MEQRNKKIFSRTSLIFGLYQKYFSLWINTLKSNLFFINSFEKLFVLSLVTTILTFSLSLNIFADNILKNVSMIAFISPKYNENTGKLEYILSGKNAKTIGAFIKINDAKLELIGPGGTSVERVITTPEAFFNRATQIIRGDKPIHYESLAAIIDGIGFDCNMKERLFHIRNNVKMIILSVDALQGNNTEKLKQQTLSQKNNSTKSNKVEQGIIRETSSSD